MVGPEGDHTRETDVRVFFNADSMTIVSKSGDPALKQWKYSEIRSAEYSYSKNPRWKTGLGLGAASVLFPPDRPAAEEGELRRRRRNRRNAASPGESDDPPEQRLH